MNGSARMLRQGLWALAVTLFIGIVILAGCSSPRPAEKPAAPEPKPLNVEQQVLSLLGAGKQSEAETLLEDYALRENSSQRINFLAGCCKRSRFHVDESSYVFTIVADQDTNTVAGQCAIHLVYLDRHQDVDLHFNALLRLADENPDDPVVRWMAGVQCRALNRNEEGVRQYQKLLERWNPGPVLVHQTYGNILDAVGRYEEALAQRRIAVAQEQKSWSYVALANTLSLLNRFTEADEAFAAAIKLKPEDAKLWTEWAGALHRAARYDEAAEKCRQAIRVSDTEGKTWMIWGACLEMKGDVQGAVEKYKRAAALGDARGQFALAACSQQGPQVKKAAEDELRRYRVAAEQGDSQAQCSLGFFYEKGYYGLSRDAAEAVRWYRKAAEQGNATALNNVGECYYKGTGVPKDAQTAYGYFILGKAAG